MCNATWRMKCLMFVIIFYTPCIVRDISTFLVILFLIQYCMTVLGSHYFNYTKFKTQVLLKKLKILRYLYSFERNRYTCHYQIKVWQNIVWNVFKINFILDNYCSLLLSFRQEAQRETLANPEHRDRSGRPPSGPILCSCHPDEVQVFAARVRQEVGPESKLERQPQWRQKWRHQEW